MTQFRVTAATPFNMVIEARPQALLRSPTILGVVDATPAFEQDGLPAYGSGFIAQGYICPAGTLTSEESGFCNGVMEDGSLEFADAVLGEWTCRGYLVSDGAHTMAGPIVLTNQLYVFGAFRGGIKDTVAFCTVSCPILRWFIYRL